MFENWLEGIFGERLRCFKEEDGIGIVGEIVGISTRLVV